MQVAYQQAAGEYKRTLREVRLARAQNVAAHLQLPDSAAAIASQGSSGHRLAALQSITADEPPPSSSSTAGSGAQGGNAVRLPALVDYAVSDADTVGTTVLCLGPAAELLAACGAELVAREQGGGYAQRNTAVLQQPSHFLFLGGCAALLARRPVGTRASRVHACTPHQRARLFGEALNLLEFWANLTPNHAPPNLHPTLRSSEQAKHSAFQQ